MSKVEYLKCISALKQRNPPPGKPTSNEKSDLTGTEATQQSMSYHMALEK